MKKIILFAALFAQTVHCAAQLEVKSNPLGAILSNPDASIEFDIANNMALEPFAGLSYADAYVGLVRFTSKGYTYGVMGKYFFTPVRGFDKVYVGIYALKGTIKYTGFALRANDIFTKLLVALSVTNGYSTTILSSIYQRQSAKESVIATNKTIIQISI
jgi:hypothetical protein